jgi:hypothetical protein
MKFLSENVHSASGAACKREESFGHVKIDAKRVSDSVALSAVVDLHKREELRVRAVTETCSSRLQARGR